MTSSKVICGECRTVVPTLGGFDFIFADPPFNIGQEYSGYDDSIDAGEYFRFTMEWVDACWDACTGVFCIHLPPQLDGLFHDVTTLFAHHRIKKVVWHYRFGQNTDSNWVDAFCECWIFARDGYTWNSKDVKVESDRVLYGDKRAAPTLEDGSENPHYEGGGLRVPGTVWGVPSDGPYWGRVQGNSKERVKGCPNQLPEAYLERLFRAYTKPGDRALDPFAGSGTFAVVGKALGCNVVTIDVSKTNCRLVRQRMKRGPVRL